MTDARIAPTAHYTAYVWYRLGLPYSELFVTPRGRQLFWAFRLAGEWIAAASRSVPSMAQYLELRHRAIDHVLEELAPDRVVELGAGLSRRGVYFAIERGLTYTEVDLPHMIEAKRAALARAPNAIRSRAAGKLSHAARDVLSADFESWLTHELAGAGRPVVIAEGLLGYFAMPERRQIVSCVLRALTAAGGGSLVCDLRSGEGGRRVAVAARALRGAIWIATRGRGAREDFASPEAARTLLVDAGFARAELVAGAVACPQLAHLRSPLRVWHASAPA